MFTPQVSLPKPKEEPTGVTCDRPISTSDLKLDPAYSLGIKKQPSIFFVPGRNQLTLLSSRAPVPYRPTTVKMISDDDLHRLAVFLGSCAMMMIVLYHFLEVNAKDTGVEDASEVKRSAAAFQESVAASPSTVPAAAAGGSSAIGGEKDR
ncbi:Oligosaccaryltransferase-domain-containing protein [Aspergillus pseudotamarii]|uniref:Dolichyl-diphosphooligosaccharide--protein glycosyltransferase subunit 4 n=1 Tax=Aspergillus pseudotamarii TaxID=132259 RepID=A0A5N6T7T0_ASPPS|nr:Oligosaccaryltransferase-domain-containing protein [Aspergillus pseudotamarii]KAE8142393.1 Oligosaccaryltransferase-domain-containing protein [Aspergillus pseudotamarii]